MNKRIGFWLVLGVAGALCWPQAAAQITLGLEEVATGLTRPLYLTAPPNDHERLFIVEQGGSIRILRGGSIEAAPFLDISGLVVCCGERGLLGLAFHPNYAANGVFYVYYTNTAGDSRVSRFLVSADPDVADPNSELILLEFAQPFGNHNGGWIGFGPRDGYLYIASGDGGSSNDSQDNAQNLGNLLGKMLRIDVDQVDPGLEYAVPPDNPFVGVTGAREEIWSYGLRNPWRSSFDRVTGDLYIADVGQNAREEVNFQSALSPGGENYGWRIFEGTRCNTTVEDQAACDTLAPDAVFPIHEYDNPADGRSITGGYVYRGNRLLPYRGTYFFADYLSARVWSFRHDGINMHEFQEHTAQLDPGGTELSAISSFGEDAAGELYIVSLDGTIHKIVDLNGAELPLCNAPWLLFAAALGGLLLYRPTRRVREQNT